ncbi:hypothetical protein KJ656_12940 [bacterium]|nr:hypothetical protein [bacterium]
MNRKIPEETHFQSGSRRIKWVSCLEKDKTNLVRLRRPEIGFTELVLNGDRECLIVI